MFSKRIAISIIVIGCLVQFLTCVEDKLNKPSKSNSRGKPAGSGIPRDAGASVSKIRPISKPRGLSTPNKVEQNNKKPVEDNKKKTPEKSTEFDNQDENEEKPSGRIRKIFSVFGRLNEFRKKLCPFRFAGRLIKRGMSLGKSKSTDEEKFEP